MSKKREFLLVDGYNVIHSWDELKETAKDSLETARQKLVDILMNYQGYITEEIILVFDAYNVERSICVEDSKLNIKVVYTTLNETADNYIERTSDELSKKHFKVRVVTSDNLERVIVFSRGGTATSSKDFLLEINNCTIKNLKDFTDNKLKTDNMLVDRIDKSTAELLEKMRRQKG